MSSYESFGLTLEDDGSVDMVEFDEKESIIETSTVNLCLQATTKLLCSKNFIKSLVLGQGLSFLLCGTGIFSGLLQNQDVNLPTSQSFLMYCMLCLIFTTRLAYKESDRNLKHILLSYDALKYAFIGLIDVEANYLVVKAYGYTTVTSVQILDCFSIAVVLLLSRLVLKTPYKWMHYAGVLISLLGLAGLIIADVVTGKNEDDDNSNAILGDMLVIFGAILYGVSNVAQEFIVKNYDRGEFLGMLGVFSTLFSGLQIIFVENQDLSKVTFTYKVVLPWLGFTIFLFLIYVCMAYVIQQTSATVTNISVLSADFYALILGIIIFNYTFHILYLVSFVIVILGVAVYSLRPTAPEIPPVNSERRQLK